MEKPTKVEVGQRWTPGDGDNFCTVIEPYDGLAAGDAHLMWASGNTGIWEKSGMLAKWRYLGPTESDKSERRPVPAKGQRWRAVPHKRWTKVAYDGEPFTLTERCDWGEMRASDGTPLTALGAIKAKRMEPAPPSEPFVPSIDDDFWIPDAPRGLVKP